MAERYFSKNSTTFNCSSCGRLTRDTRRTNLQMCSQCDECERIENMILDEDITDSELVEAESRIAELRAEAMAKGGRFLSIVGESHVS